MPGRALPLITSEIYHVFNRGIDHRPTFPDKRKLTRALEVITFYRFSTLPVSLSTFLRMSQQRREEIIKSLEVNSKRLIDIFAYCFMPNHFHFLLRQKQNSGISKFMSNFQNSYTRYFNLRLNRTGPLFLDQFKAVRIETDEQFLHVSRYIHLNPYTSFIVKTVTDLEIYPWSSLPEYLGKLKRICTTQMLLSFFKAKTSLKKFIINQADYQRSLESIKHLALE